MNKYDIIEEVSRVTCAKKEARDAVNRTIHTIIDALKKGDKVSLMGLGSFYVKTRKARIGRNPKTGEVVNISARRVLRFVPSKKFFS